MERLISIYAFTQQVQIDEVRVPVDKEQLKARPILSKGVVLVPVSFFHSVWNMEISQEQGCVHIEGNEHVLFAEEGKLTFVIDGVSALYSISPKMEQGIFCVPAVETAQALGIVAEQFDMLCVFSNVKTIEALKKDARAVDKLAEKTCGIYNAAAFSSEDFKKARDVWRRNLCGDSRSNDLSIPGMRKLLEMRDLDSDTLRQEMNRELDAVILYGDIPPSTSDDLPLQYRRILRMAQPYGTYGCRGYKDKMLLEDVIYALDWMHDHMFGANVLSDSSYRSWRKFDWWGWYQGASNPLMDTLMIIEQEISKERLDKYLLPVEFLKTQMCVDLNAAEALSRIRPLPPLALLKEDRALLQAAYLDAETLLKEHDTGNNMRRDWCSMSHGMPYNIGYGITTLIYLANTLYNLEDTPLAFPCRKKYNLMKQVRYTFGPALYRGQAISMMNGRIMQRDSSVQCAELLIELYRLFDLFGEEENEELYQLLCRHGVSKTRRLMLRGYDIGDTSLEEYRSIGVKEEPKTSTLAYSRCYRAMSDDRYKTSPMVLGYMWYSGDSCVQFRNDCLFALRMYSERTLNYECINGSNLDGWYTGDGMFYLYTPRDEEQYSELWWKNVNKYLMPGTTVEDRPREALSIIEPYHSNRDFVGGVSLERQFLCASMDFESFHWEEDHGIEDTGYGTSLPVFHCTLTALKSYFMFDRVAVALGCCINAQDDYPVRTIIENRRLTEEMKEVRINGELFTCKPMKDTRTDISNIYIPGVAAYIFPLGGEITINIYENGGELFFACWFEHGINPINEQYAYIVLPNVEFNEMVAYLGLDDIEILDNNETVQCVREKHSNLTGIVFRQAKTLGTIEAMQPMIIMTKESDEKLMFSVSDPTQKLEQLSFCVGGSHVDNHDKNMEYTQKGKAVEVLIHCDSARGRTYSGVVLKD